MVEWLSLAVAVLALGLSWWWRALSKRDDAETRGIALGAAEAQERLANARPWTVERHPTGPLLFTNGTGDVARAVELSAEAPWYFWDDQARDHYRTEQSALVEHDRIEPGSSVMHIVTTDAESTVRTMLRVRWTDSTDTRREWTFPALWAGLG